MHRALLSNHTVNSRTSKLVQRWSILERGCLQGSSSTGIHSGGRCEKEDESERDSRREARGTDAEDSRPIKTAGRGRGAFSHFLRLHERNIDKHSAVGSRSRGGRRARDQGVSGQVSPPMQSRLPREPGNSIRFDDAEEDGGTGENVGSRSTDGTDGDLPEKRGVVRGKLADGKMSLETWVREWFAQVKEEGDPNEPDWDDLDDEEDGYGGDENEEFGEKTWWVEDKEEFEKYKEMVARMEREEREQLDALQEQWERMKLQAAEEGNTKKLELPFITITSEMTFEAPEGTATMDRPKPQPRNLEAILASMELPSDLDVRPNDPEYDQVVNMWKTVSRNNTMDQRTKEEAVRGIATFIAKHRNSDALDKALGLKEIERPRGGKRKAR